MKMTLARALRYKKRVVAKISQLEHDIQTYNAVLENAEREINVSEAMNKRDDTVKHLTELKLAITQGTAPVFPLILEVAEIKSKIAFLGRIPTNHGVTADRWGDGKDVRYVAIFRKASIQVMVNDLQTKIDDLQAKIDAHNNKTTVEVSDLDLN